MTNFHSQPIGDTVRQLDTQLAHGLTQADVQQRLAKHGENALPAHRRVPLWRLFLAQFKDFVVLLLVAAALISLLLGDTLEGSAIFVIVLMNAVISLIQEQRADAALEELQKLSAPEAHVLRDGVRQAVPVRELVPGDVVFLEAGNYVPADLQLVESANLQINEAALTGESDAVAKNAEQVVAPSAPIGDRLNMAFSSTLVTQGRGQGIVTATGLHTEIGLIARMMSEITEEITPLQRRLNQMGKTLSLVALALCAVIFVVQLIRNSDLSLIVGAGLMAYLRAESAVISDVFILAVSLAVAAVPEGLAAVVTINLAIGMREMVKHHALVRRLNAVETLGSTTVICSDKTGTLTQNAMSVVQAYAGDRTYHVTGERYNPLGEFIDAATGQAYQFGEPDLADVQPLSMLLRGALLSSDALLERVDDQYRTVGDATEGALVVAAAKAGLWRADVERDLPRINEIPFDADRKMMTTVHRSAAQSDQALWVFTKGAPDMVLAHCHTLMQADGHICPLLLADRERLREANEAMGRAALRVLAVAMRRVRADAVPHLIDARAAIDLEHELVFIGLLGMMDPPRLEVPAAIQRAREAGIRTVMITGDYPITARAIASQIGLTHPDTDAEPEPRILSGPELAAMSDDTLASHVRNVNIFARVSPEHKVRIVSAMKRNNHIVAMTGDGVNDAPALKRADIGIAMGITGTDVSKETADMVLTDDNFASIVSAVEQGRVIYANIRKFVFYLLGCNVAEIFILLFATLLGLPSPLSAIQLLWLNLLTDGAPALALGLERGEPGLMRQPPRPAHEPIINRRMVRQLAVQTIALVLVVLGVYQVALVNWPAQASTMAFLTLALAELPLAYSARTEHGPVLRIGVWSNPKMQWAVLLSLVGVIAVIYVPVLQAIFGTQPLSATHWLWVLPACLLPTILAEAVKLRFFSTAPAV